MLHAWNRLIENHPSHYLTNVLKTICEIQIILYLAVFRNAHAIFCFYYLIFQHWILNTKHIQVFFWRLLPLTSLLCTKPVAHFLGEKEGRKEEATFNFLKIMANLTSNRKLDLVLYNCIVRFQVQNKNDSLFLFWLCNFPVLDINLETYSSLFKDDDRTDILWCLVPLTSLLCTRSVVHLFGESHKYWKERSNF